MATSIHWSWPDNFCGLGPALKVLSHLCGDENRRIQIRVSLLRDINSMRTIKTVAHQYKHITCLVALVSFSQ